MMGSKGNDIVLRRVWQEDRHRFAIEWGDGLVQRFKLSDLQRSCSCAACTDEHTGQRLVAPESVAEDVTAKSVSNVGRYALRIQFSSGCSNGIYGFDLLRQIGMVEEAAPDEPVGVDQGKEQDS